MTTEERDIRLTAYALNDPSLTSSVRDKIEATLASDAGTRQAVEETRQLAQVLTEGLAAEQNALPMAKPVTIPATRPVPATRRWAKYVVAATVVVAVCGAGFVGWSKWQDEHEKKLAMDFKRGIDLASPNEVVIFENGYRPAFGQSPNVMRAPSLNPLTGVRAVSDDSTSAIREEGALKDGAEGDKPVDALTMPGKRGAGVTAMPIAPGPAGPGMPGGPKGPIVRSQFSPPKPDASVPGGVVRSNPPAGAPLGLMDTLKDAKEAAFRLPAPMGEDAPPESRDRHLQLIENSFTKVEGMNALSTFGVDVDTASYAIVRKYLAMNQLPPPNAVRLEELVNYFPYVDKPPQGDDPFAVTVEMAECPWEPAHRLVRLGLKAKTIDVDKRPPSNLVFLIDVSGSMNEPNRLPLVKQSLKLLVNQLGENDRVAMVVYAGTTGLVLDSTSALKKEKILNALDVLEAGGSTNGAGGMQQAYDVAVANFIKGGTNRVILCTDGDWNVGTTSTEALVKMIEQKRETGVFLSVFGFGMGNLRDEMMVQLAGKGNGNYGYIDTLKEANKAFVEQLGGTLVTVAKDVKIQVEFNPTVIKSYRLLGYEKRALAAKDFHDDKKDAGEMGAGHVVTALYELVPAGVADPIVGKVDGLRYQQDPAPAKPAVKGDKMNEAFVVKMRHKKPDSDSSALRELPVSDVTKTYDKASEDFQFAAAVASFSMILRDSQYKGNSNYALVLELAEAAKKHDPSGYRAEFIEMVKKAKALSGK